MIVVSGATGGIGGAVATRLWSCGHDVALLGRNKEKLIALEKKLSTQEDDGRKILLIPFDVTKPEEWTALQQALYEHGDAVTGLVVCHGAPPQPCNIFDQDSLRIFENVYQTDVLGTLKLCRIIGHRLVQKKRGSIVIISSIHAEATYPERVHYAVAKTALTGLVRALAVEWGHVHVTVNCIAPWQTRGGRTDAVALQEFMRSETGENTLELYRQRVPTRELVTPEDIARTVQWLLETPSVNGQTIILDHGLRASAWHKPYLSMEGM